MKSALEVKNLLKSKQEVETTNLSNLNIPSEFSFPDIFTGQLSNGEKIYFESHAIAEDNDCGFHALGLDRSKAVTQLLAHAKDENIRHLIAPEIQAAFLEGTLPKEMQDNEYQSLWSLFPIERKLDIYCEKEETFKAFVTHYLSKGGWLTYIGNYQNKTQQTSSLDALAELNHIQVFIWQGNPSNPQQLQLVHQYGKLEYPTIHMLHTHGMTHYDLLQQVEKPALELAFPKPIKKGKEEENALHSLPGLTESLSLSHEPTYIELSYEELLQQADETKQKDQLVIAEKQYAKALQKAVMANRYDQQADCLKSLGDMYLNKKEYTQACALYNAARIRCEKADYSDKDKILQQEVLIQRIKDTEKLLLEEALHRPVKADEISVWAMDEQHKKELEALRQECKQTLAKIDQAYPLDQIYEYGEEENKEKEAKLHELQLARAEQIRNLYHYIAEAIKKLIRQMLEECQTVLGNPPCDYAIMGLGSLAREEMTPYSDLEFVILIAEEEEAYKQYFRNLTKLLHLKVINLGETILPAMAIPALNDYYSNNPLDNWFYDDVTPRGFAFDGAMPQACKTPLGKKDRNGKVTYELIHTPTEMVKFLEKKRDDPEKSYWFSYESRLAILLMETSLIAGSVDLDAVYQAKLQNFLNSVDDRSQLQIRRMNLMSILKTRLEEYKFDLGNINSEGKLFSIKQDFYILLDNLLSILSFYYGGISRSAWDKVEELNKKSYINNEAKCNLQIVISIATELRLGAYLKYAQQQEDMSIYFSTISSNKNNVANREIFNVPSLSHIFRYYYTVLPLHKSIMELLQLQSEQSSLSETRLKQNNFYDSSSRIKGLIHKRLLQYQEAKNCFEKTITESPEDVEIHYYLGSVLETLGEYHKALEHYEFIFQMYQKGYNIILEQNNKSSILIILNSITNIMIALGKYTEALQYGQQAQAIGMQFYSDELSKEEAIATSLNNLGTVYKKLGNYEYTLTYYQKALLIQKRLYNEQPHPAIATTLNNLGTAYWILSQFDKAITYYYQALTMRKQLYGKQHLAIADSLNKLGIAYEGLGQFDKAIAYYHEVLTMRKQLYGEQPHLAIADSLNKLGIAYKGLGQFEQAIAYYHEVLTMRKQLYGEQPHLAIADSLNNLGIAYSALGQWEQAISLFQQSHRICTLLLGEDHLTTKQVERSLFYVSLKLGNRLFLEGKTQEAKKYYNIVNIDLEDIVLQQTLLNFYYGANDLMQVIEHAKIIMLLNPTDASGHHNLACFYHIEAQLAKEKGNELVYQEKLKEAKITFQKALSSSASNPYSAINAEYANFLYQNNAYQEALPYLLKAIKFKANGGNLTYGKMEKPTVNTELQTEIDFRGEVQLKGFVLAYRLLVSVYKNLGQSSEAEKALAEFAQVVENKEDALAFVLLGHAYRELDQWEKAAAAYQKAIHYYQPTSEQTNYLLAENYWQAIQSLNSNKSEQKIVSNDTQITAKDEKDALSAAIALSLNLNKTNKVIFGSNDLMMSTLPLTSLLPANKEISMKSIEELFPTSEQIVHNKAEYQRVFCDYFLEKLNNYQYIHEGRARAESGKKALYAMEMAEWVSVLSGLAAPIPLAGPFLIVALPAAAKLVQTCIKLGSEQLQAMKAKTITELSKTLALAEINTTIEEVGAELTRIYEYQIAVLADDSMIRTMAYDAVQRIFNYGSRHKNLFFERNTLLQGVIKGKSDSHKDLKTLFDTPQGKLFKRWLTSWHTGSIYEGPGLRKEDEYGVYYYRYRESDTEKYGYRGKLLHIIKENTYIEHEIDKDYNLNKDQYTLHQSYIPITRIVYRQTLEEYAAYIKKQRENNLDISSLNNYISQKYYKSAHFVTAIYRSGSLKELDLSKGRFDQCDLIRADLSLCKLESASFCNSQLIKVSLADVEAEKADFTKANLLFTDITGAELKSTRLVQADMRYVIADAATNTRYAATSGFNINDSTYYLAKSDVNIKDKLKKRDERITKLEQALERLTQKQENEEFALITSQSIGQVVPHYYSRYAFDNLTDILAQNALIAVTGFPGAGKTQLVEYYAHEFIFNHPSAVVWKFDASNSKLLAIDFEMLAERLGIPKRSENTNIISGVNDKLVKRKGGFLLIFDNAPDYTTIQPFIPSFLSSPNYQVLITSQNSNFENVILFPLSGFESDEAKVFLIGETKDSALIDAAKELANSMSYMPLGLAAAKLYIKAHDLSIRGYLDLINREGEDIEKYESKEIKAFYKQGSLHKVLRCTVKSLPTYPRHLLNLTSLLATEKISLSLLAESLQHYRLSLNESKLRHYIRVLKEHSLIATYGTDEKVLVSLHSITQKVVLTELSKDLVVKKNYVGQLLSVLAKNFTKDTRDAVHFEKNVLLSPHVDALLQHAEAYDEPEIQLSIAKLLDVKAYFYSQMGMAKSSKEMFIRAKAICEKLVNISYSFKVIPEAELSTLATKIYQGLSQIQGLTELYISICYSFGRTYFYTREEQHKPMLVQLLQLAYKLCEEFEKNKKSHLYHQFLIEANGLLYLKLEKDTKTPQNYEQDLNYAKQRYEALLQDERPYYERGKERYISRKHSKEAKNYIHMSTDEQREFNNELYNEMICHLQLARTLQKVAHLLADKPNECQKNFQQAFTHLKTTIGLARQQLAAGKKLERLADYYNIYGNVLLDERNSARNIKEAINKFRSALREERNKNNKQGKWDFPLADAHYGLASAYFQCNGAENLMKAKLHIQDCLHIRREIYPLNHPDIAAAEQLEKIIITALAKQETSAQQSAARIIQRHWHQYKPTLFFTALEEKVEKQPLSPKEQALDTLVEKEDDELAKALQLSLGETYENKMY